METLWHSKGIKHYRLEMDDWLGLRKAGDQSSQSVVLHEGTHHYFKEMYLFDTEGRRRMRRRLDGPGPFEIELDEVGDCMILVRVHFFGYTRSPLSNGQIMTEKCAVIHKNGREEPVVMQINNEPTGLHVGTDRFPGAETVWQSFDGISTGGGVVELVRGDQRSVPFHLRVPVDADVLVFRLGSQRVPASLVPGQEVEVSALKAALPDYVIIRAGQHAPAPSAAAAPATTRSGDPPGGWSVAVPVRLQNPLTGLVGKPLAVSPLMENLEVEYLPPSVYASWKWLGPQPWTSVLLTWDFYSGDQLADWPVESCRVTLPLYRGNCFQLPIDSRNWRHWCVRVTATARLLNDDEGSDPPLEHYIQL